MRFVGKIYKIAPFYLATNYFLEQKYSQRETCGHIFCSLSSLYQPNGTAIEHIRHDTATTNQEEYQTQKWTQKKWKKKHTHTFIYSLRRALCEWAETTNVTERWNESHQNIASKISPYVFVSVSVVWICVFFDFVVVVFFYFYFFQAACSFKNQHTRKKTTTTK